jgi:RNA polymerase sigma-54 factor
MQQSIEILMLPLLELQTAVTQELQNNPLLEIDEEKTLLKNSEIEAIVERNLARFKSSPTEYHYDNFAGFDNPEMDDKFTDRHVSLEEYMLQQLHIEIDDPADIKIGEFIIGSLNEDGYLIFSCEDIAHFCKVKDIGRVQSVLKIIQSFDPPGIGARDLRECLLAQLAGSGEDETRSLMRILIDKHLEDLSRKRFLEIAKALKVPVDKVRAAAKSISLLEPRPARKFSHLHPHMYIRPDIVISKIKNDEYEVVINNEHIPVLRVNSKYQNMLKNPVLKEEEKNFIRERMKNAVYFIKSIEQRDKTMRDIVEYILNHQKDFWENGARGLKPLILKEVAEAIGRNESTVSRAINGKFAETPQGIYPLKYFFSQSVDDGEVRVANRTIQEEIRDLVNDEDKTSPLSDEEIKKILEDRGMKVARRTITKYRKNLNILPAYLRKE